MSTSYTLIDYFNGFQQLKRMKRFSAGVQSTYFALLGEFNLRRFPDELELSTRDLKSLAGLKSVSSTHEARNILKNNKLVDFHTRNGISVYTLGIEHLPNTNRTPSEQPSGNQPNDNRTPHALSSNASLSTQETKTETRKDTPPTPPRGESERETLKGTGIEEPDSSDIFDVWAQEARVILNDRQRCDLQSLIESGKYSFEQVKTAIVKMADSRSFKTYDAFKDILAGKNEPQPLKGGEKNGESKPRYKLPPKYDFLGDF